MNRLVFVDTWAWLALALKRDQHHAAAAAQHAAFAASARKYVTSDYVLSELITQLYRVTDADKAERFVTAVLDAIDTGVYQLETVSPERFQAAWNLRRKYLDKASISFVDFTSFVIAQELDIVDIFSGDAHFQHVNLGFRLSP